MEYNFTEIEKKWQEFWKKNETYKVDIDKNKPKYYVLDMFPYPSGAGLHVGHPLGYIASDIYSRYKRLNGFNVLHPMGYDAFGLPAEQYAIQTGQHPAITTDTNIKRYREQLDKIGFSYDWDREVKTCDPKYYHWTQWVFIKMFEHWYNNDTQKAEPISELISEFEKNGNKNINASCNETEIFSAEDWNKKSEKEQQETLLNYRLAYLADTMVNWCAELGTVLANDEVINGFSERGGHPVEQKKMKQWSLRISAYASRLLDDLEELEWTDSLKEIQRNWIGRSVGAEMKFRLSPALSKGEGEKTLGYHTADKLSYGINKDNANELKNNPTEAESIIWKHLKNKQTEYKIRRQHIIDRFIVDFVCLSKKTIIEIDGKIHLDQKTQDEERNKILNEQGYDVIRFTNEEIISNPESVCEKIKDYLDNKVLPLGEDLGGAEYLTVFTTRPDTIYGVSFMVLAPESDYVPLVTTSEYKKDIDAYIKATKKRTERERMAEVKKVSGQFTGAYAINPFTNKEIPIYISDYVLAGYGTGAIMAVPGHDSRDFKFARHFNLPIVQVVVAKGEKPSDTNTWEDSFDGKEGTMINSDIINGLDVNNAIAKTIDEIEKRGIGKRQINYRLRDAIFSRQRYWGEPFPIYYKDGIPYAMKESELPLELPEVDKFLPTEDGQPPLGRAKNWKTKDGYPIELSTMPGFAGSSAYYYRYMDPKNPNELISKEANDYWQDVDLYIGGTEHATGHLIYSRFWNKFLFDLGLVCKKEPYKKLINQGMIQGRSNFIYRIDYSYQRTVSEDAEQYIIPPILLSKSIYDNFINGNLTEKEKVIISEKKIKVKDYVEKTYGGTLTYLEKASPIHVDINLVKNDILNIDEFKKSKKEFQNTEFILNNNGEYKCGWEVEKMSKSKYNVVNPDNIYDENGNLIQEGIIEKYGADTLRMYEMFLGPLEQSKPWDTNGIDGVFKFFRKLWRLYHDDNGNKNISDEAATKDELKILHKTIKKVKSDIENFSFNTSVSAFMICVNELGNLKCNKKEILEPLTIILSPFAPHIAEELWQVLGNNPSVVDAKFPEFDESFLVENTINYPVSFNGKTRFTLELPADISKEEAEKIVMEHELSAKWLEGKSPKKIIVVPKRIINIVV